MVMKEEPSVQPANYPLGEFRINDTRVVFVTKGTPYLSIAEKYNVSLGRIFEFNELRQAEVAANDQYHFFNIIAAFYMIIECLYRFSILAAHFI